jgi:hypothetical protein
MSSGRKFANRPNPSGVCADVCDSGLRYASFCGAHIAPESSDVRMGA